MTKTRVIRVLSFIMALTLVFAMFSAPSYAIDKQQFSAWIASALTALNITYTSTVAPYYQFLDYLQDPFQISDTGVVEYVPYSIGSDAVDDILDRSTISFKGEKVIIDGKEYTDIWLSHDAAEAFRTNAFDIKTAWDIASESEGTYVSGVGTYAGIPVFGLNSQYKSQFINLPASSGSYKVGDVILNITTHDVTPAVSPFNLSATFPDGRVFNGSGAFYSNIPNHGAAVFNNQSISVDSWSGGNYPNGYFAYSAGVGDSSYFNNEPFDFDWVAGHIPAEPLTSDDGLHLRVPTDPSQWSDDPDTQQIINNFNNYLELNPDLAPDVDLDLDDPDILDKIGDLLDILRPIIDLLKPEFSPKGSEPTPPVPPEPGDLIPDTPWSYLEDILNNIIQKLQNLWEKLTDILTINTGIKNSIDALREWLRSFENTLFSHITQIRDYVYNILQQIQNLVDKLLTHDADWFKDIVDSIWNPFLRIFAIFKSHIGIWHYVVDWLYHISAPFSFFYSVLVGLGPVFTAPIFAAFAGVLVIAIYRRFGR